MARGENVKTKKFMQTLSVEQFREVRLAAKERGTNVQTYIRIVIIPLWSKTYWAKRLKGFPNE